MNDELDEEIWGPAPDPATVPPEPVEVEIPLSNLEPGDVVAHPISGVGGVIETSYNAHADMWFIHYEATMTAGHAGDTVMVLRWPNGERWPDGNWRNP